MQLLKFKWKFLFDTVFFCLMWCIPRKS